MCVSVCVWGGGGILRKGVGYTSVWEEGGGAAGGERKVVEGGWGGR